MPQHTHTQQKSIIYRLVTILLSVLHADAFVAIWMHVATSVAQLNAPGIPPIDNWVGLMDNENVYLLKTVWNGVRVTYECSVRLGAFESS